MKSHEPEPHCEVSAVEVIDSRIFLGSDKPIPGENRSSIFYYDRPASQLSGQAEHFVTSPYARTAIKFEAFARVPGTNVVIASTGFDRVKDDGSWDGFNTLLALNAKQADSIQVINPSVRADTISSRKLRDQIKNALKNEDFPNGPPYFKVEGLAVLPDRRILFGLRETGKRYDNFDFHRTILAGRLVGDFPNLALKGDLKIVFDFTDYQTKDISEPLGISSIAYDRKRAGLWILTSYETQATDEGVGGYLWFLPRKQLESQEGVPQLILDRGGKPLHFAHKSEGLSILENGDLFVVHDDDRVTGRKDVTDKRTQFYRALNQSFFDIVRIH